MALSKDQTRKLLVIAGSLSSYQVNDVFKKVGMKPDWKHEDWSKAVKDAGVGTYHHDTAFLLNDVIQEYGIHYTKEENIANQFGMHPTEYLTFNDQKKSYVAGGTIHKVYTKTRDEAKTLINNWSGTQLDPGFRYRILD